MASNSNDRILIFQEPQSRYVLNFFLFSKRYARKKIPMNYCTLTKHVLSLVSKLTANIVVVKSGRVVLRIQTMMVALKLSPEKPLYS